ncbi:hypothetical protein OIV83_002058 [Microbotryomycetes sp. JL201]|nr:hypothetical protein OIV83_002058 [Microbotryomycetes sp. JL201]
MPPPHSASGSRPSSTSSKSNTRPTSSNTVNHNSLSSIVSQLVRSQYGESASSVPDDQLDQHVAQMLLQDAHKKQQQWNERGSYLDVQPDKNAPIRKPNKRFLTNMIKSVDDHNQALLRQEREVIRKRERDERDAADEWRREFRQESKRSHNRRHDDDRNESKSEDGYGYRRRYGDEDEHGRERRRDKERRSDHASGSRRHRSDRDSDDEYYERRRSHRDHSRSNDERRSSLSPQRRRDAESIDVSPSRQSRHKDRSGKEQDDSKHGQARSERGKRHEYDDERRDRERRAFKDVSTTEQSVDDVLAQIESETNDKRSRSDRDMPRASPPPKPSTAPPSKMDKYFEPDYDPRLDVNLDHVTQSNGLIADAGFDGWNTMLQVIRERKEEKKEREWREKLERKREREKVRKEREHRRKRRRGESVSSGEDPGEEARDRGTGSGLMEIEYSKRGSTREWDLGKQTAT